MAQSPDIPEKCIDNYKYIFNRDLLKGKVAFVTGGGSGICFTIAEVFMRHGCDTVILSRKMDRLKRSAEILSRATGQRCLPIQMDVRKPQEILNAVDETLKQFGRIDILINGAAGNFLCPAAGLSFNAFKTVMEIDAHGTFNVSKAVYDKYMKKNGGIIVNITATLQIRGQVLQTHAGAAKAAIETITKHLAVEWGMDGIRVMCVAPGPIADTEGFRKLGKTGKEIHRELSDVYGSSAPSYAQVKFWVGDATDEEMCNKVLDLVYCDRLIQVEEIAQALGISHGGEQINTDYVKSIPVQRVGTREDIGNTVLYVVSDAAQLLTGTTIIADGGDWLSSTNNYYGIMKSGGKRLNSEHEKSIPVQRVGTREDIGNTVLYVVSDAAQLLTGTTIIADGGHWLSSSNDYYAVLKSGLLQKL